ncbi:MAG TPA: hypothetical protein VMR25_25820 [Planctomycetaceae bacterium]|nr:hypothetical protein [Planctomycetaceae bacterium]
MNAVESLLKSIGRERLFAGLTAACFYFAGAVLGLAVELKYVSPAAKQFLPLCCVVGLIATSHTVLSLRLESALKALTAPPAPQKPE